MSLSANAFRTALVSLAVVLVSIATISLWRFGTTATDENLFTPPPSAASLTEPIAGRVVVDGQLGAPDATALRPGDLVTFIDGAGVRTVSQFEDAALRPRERARVVVVRGGPGSEVEVEVAGEDLRRVAIRNVARTAFVIEVTPGGASDRAGMRVGDLITRINGQPFNNVLEADAILRSGTIGNATTYDIVRGNQELKLRVTLAAFGVRLSLVMMSIGALTFTIFGLFVGLARPALSAARYLALSFVLVGYVLSVVLVRRPLDPSLLAYVRDLALFAAVSFGLATVLHAALYFPRSRSTVLAKRWVLPGAYAIAALTTFAMSRGGTNTGLFTLLLVNLGYGGVVRWMGRKDLPPDARRMARPLTVTAILVSIGCMLAISGVIWPQRAASPDPRFAGLLLPIIPITHLWVIGRHRLLDLNLRLRRHVQYSLVSTAWGLVPLALLVWLVLTLPQIRFPVPNVRIQGSSVEVLGQPLGSEARATVEKIALMVVAIFLAFSLRWLARAGEHRIAAKFHRAQHDYRRAAKELTKLVTARPDLEGLSTGLVDVVATLFQLKRVGTVFFREDQSYCGKRAHGFEDEDWQLVAADPRDIEEGVARAHEEVNAEYVFPRLRRLLTSIEVHYLFPLRSHDELVGALLLGEKMAEDAFRDEDFEFLGALSSQVAPAIENAFLYTELARQERLKHELEIARRIQMESLPQFTPTVAGLDVAGVSIPAFEVGGDYFDYLNGRPGQLTVMVGDVSGKGTSAALYMSKLQGIVRSLHVFDLEPRDLFVRTNDLLCRDLERRSFVTAIGGFFDTGMREMVLARAGHLPLYHYSARTGEVSRVLTRGLGFGLSTRPIFESELEARTIPYGAGDVFLFITDGITECQGTSGEEFGEDRVIALLRSQSQATALEIRDHITSAVRAYSATAQQFDDQTVVVVKATS